MTVAGWKTLLRSHGGSGQKTTAAKHM